MTETQNPRVPPSEEVERLKQQEREQLITSLVNIRELNPEVYEDGLEWLQALSAVSNGSFSEEVGIVDLRLGELRKKYPKPSEYFDSDFQQASPEVRICSLFMDYTVLPMLGRLYDLDGSKIFSQSYQLKMLPKHSVSVPEGGGN